MRRSALKAREAARALAPTLPTSALRALSTSSALPTGSTLHTTTLDCGVRVATESTPGHFAAVGVYVDSGTRYETPVTAGSSHMLSVAALP